MRTLHRSLTAAVALTLAGACSSPTTTPPPPVSATNHTFFPIGAGSTHPLGSMTKEGALACDSCHRASAESFTQVRCDTCHKHSETITPRLHLGVADFAVDTSAVSDPMAKAELRGAKCVSCHPTGEPQPFTHTGIVAQCAECHAEGNAFAALPKPGFTHPNVGAADCGGCHVTTSWTGAGLAPSGVFDPSKSLTLTGLVPSFTATTITRVSPQVQTLPMTMNHNSTSIDAGILSDCTVCHQDSANGVYFPGNLHSSLAELGVAQPTRCAECHGLTRPEGFVGPLAAAPARTPPTGEMRHEAVNWTGGMRGTTELLTADCATCHQPPNKLFSVWNNGDGDGGTPRFHASLTATSQPQPTSCLDCHANSRPTTTLSAPAAALPVGMTFDHQSTETLGECSSCHASTSTWTGGKFHAAGQPTLLTCVSCHEAERPTSTTGWQSTSYMRSPFDYGTNAQGIKHGGGEDCAVCHAGSTSTWVGGAFPHGPNTLAATTCSACHVSQRPTAVVQTFDHSLNGTGECRACHQATVVAGRYVDLVNPNTMMLPGGDWQGGRTYPGDIVVTSPTQFVQLSTWTLQKNGTGFVTGITAGQTTLFNAMLHTSSVIPTEVNPGTATTPDMTSCWHCHTNTNGTVTAYSNGLYHQALTNYSAMPGGTVMALPQPTTKCADCHEQMRPNLIVEKSASVLQPMDHSATFTAATTIGGQSVTGVPGLDCSTCHKTAAGTTWSDGKFHANIATATPANCVQCHYPVMASATADITSGTTFAMKHRSPQLTLQRCETCHTTALSKAAMMPPAGPLWATGALHPHVSPQPGACLECHSTSEPAQATQSQVSWTFAMGATATNSTQWMNHQVPDVQSRDCATCHAPDAKTSGSAWSKATSYHSHVTAPTACAICHGTSNGRGTVVGTNNNLPTGLTSSRVTTTASNAPMAKDQLSHADVNVTGHDCNFCHTQKGTSTTMGIQGAEWKQATFHRNFSAASPLVMNLTTGRCSTCHFNLKPGPTFTTFDHSTYTATSGTPDCSSCHSWPGTSTTTPNWLGAAAQPAFISVGGFTIPNPPATTTGSLQVGIANLPHPSSTGLMCTSCHPMAAGGRRAFGYDHLSTLINSKCNACHEAGSDLVGTVWNGATTVAAGAGDTRPFTLPSVQATYKGNTKTETYPKHFFPIDCKECHVIPTGLGLTMSGTALRTQWKFPHTTSKMTNPATCLTCHPNGAPN